MPGKGSGGEKTHRHNPSSIPQKIWEHMGVRGKTNTEKIWESVGGSCGPFREALPQEEGPGHGLGLEGPGAAEGRGGQERRAP
eukprot:8869520-Pyramimonas_sp.AAC.1